MIIRGVSPNCSTRESGGTAAAEEEEDEADEDEVDEEDKGVVGGMNGVSLRTAAGPLAMLPQEAEVEAAVRQMLDIQHEYKSPPRPAAPLPLNPVHPPPSPISDTPDAPSAEGER